MALYSSLKGGCSEAGVSLFSNVKKKKRKITSIATFPSHSRLLFIGFLSKKDGTTSVCSLLSDPSCTPLLPGSHPTSSSAPQQPSSCNVFRVEQVGHSSQLLEKHL